MVIGPDGSLVAGPEESRRNDQQAALKKLVLPATGEYRIEVQDASLQGGRYLLETKASYPKFPVSVVAVAPAVRSEVLLFDLIPGCTIRQLGIGRLRAKGQWKQIDGRPSKLVPLVESLHAPDGSEIDFWSEAKVKAKSKQFTISRLRVTQLGAYQVVVGGDRDSVGYGQASLTVRYPVPKLTHQVP